MKFTVEFDRALIKRDDVAMLFERLFPTCLITTGGHHIAVHSRFNDIIRREFIITGNGSDW